VSEWVVVEGDESASCDEPQVREIVVIRSNKPGYCTDYESHAWAYQLETRYVGNELTGGIGNR
jgi:hypothetical protein